MITAILVISTTFQSPLTRARTMIEQGLSKADKPLSLSRIEASLSYSELAMKSVSKVVGRIGWYAISVGYESGTATYLVSPTATLHLAGATSAAKGSGSVLVDRVEISGDRMLLSGLEGWYGNAPSYAFELYRMRGKEWQFLSRNVSEFEAWGADLPTGTLAGKTFIVKSRTYPPHLNTSHASALYGMAESFRIEGSQIKKLDSVKLSTAFNTLDELSKAFQKSDTATIRKIVPNPIHRTTVEATWHGWTNPSARPTGNVGSVGGTDYTVEENGLRLRLKFSMTSNRWVVKLAELKPADH